MANLTDGMCESYNAGKFQEFSELFTQDAVLMASGYDKFIGREGLRICIN